MNLLPPIFTALSDLQIALWSASLGIFLSYALLSSFYATYNRSLSGMQTAFFVLLSGLFVLCASGLLGHFAQFSVQQQALWMIIGGPVVAAGSALGLRQFLRGEMRDTLVDRGMQAIAALSASLVLGALWPNQDQALGWVGIGVALAAVGGFWLSLRSWLLGDRLALPMTLACAFLAFAVLGLYANALGILSSNAPLQVATAASSAAYVVLICHTLKRRHVQYARMKKACR
ncbi:MAG: 7TM diverse intracellular signaling domain-containing protein [Brachymonas sp.]